MRFETTRFTLILNTQNTIRVHFLNNFQKFCTNLPFGNKKVEIFSQGSPKTVRLIWGMGCSHSKVFGA